MEWFGNLFCAAVLVMGLVLDTVAVTDLPQPVAQAVAQRYPKLHVVEVEQDREASMQVLEVKLRGGDQQVEADFALDGKFVSAEEELAWQGVPEVVRAPFTKAYGDVTPSEVTRYTRVHDGQERVTYVIESRVNGREREFGVSADGHVIFDRLD